ncbi:PAP fimbrial minor pilin protein precursor [Serratia entomophila]|nr:PAP fimbrial minor pilin protein precursor [Serratia entomophila]CAI1131600.1 PAP fimbrial minor pilin protein precursor [Serratia entomophila]CAI2082999.1 PAP fimbrial minor pilin protein precursor [Serratia entomophila]
MQHAGLPACFSRSLSVGKSVNREYSMSYFPAKLMLPCLLASLLMANSAYAAHSTQGWGRVNMQGAIIDTACAISAGSREQVIDIGITPAADIMRDGSGGGRHFSIELINCVLSRAESKLPDWSGFQVTFDGDADGELFEVHGGAKGVGLQIVDAEGNIARPGNPLLIREILPGRMLLNYQMRLVANKQPLRAGGYYSAVRFKMDYY